MGQWSAGWLVSKPLLTLRGCRLSLSGPHTNAHTPLLATHTIHSLLPAAAEAKHGAPHGLDGDISGEHKEVPPGEPASVFELDGLQQHLGLV